MIWAIIQGMYLKRGDEVAENDRKEDKDDKSKDEKAKTKKAKQ